MQFHGLTLLKRRFSIEELANGLNIRVLINSDMRIFVRSRRRSWRRCRNCRSDWQRRLVLDLIRITTMQWGSSWSTERQLIPQLMRVLEADEWHEVGG
jgi:hypothetical protein